MRHLWGHGVGHTYCHSDAPSLAEPSDPTDLEVTTTHPGPTINEREHTETVDYQDTLEDLEGAELEIACGSEDESCEDDDSDIQDPDDEFRDEVLW